VKRNIRSAYNAISALALMLTTGIFGLIVTKLIIETYGSDFYGLNATATQIITIVLLLEGGFTLAANVALLKPYTSKNYDVVNGIAAATHRTFRKAGALSLLFGATLVVLYSFFINSGLSQGFIILVLMMTVFPVSVNLFAVTKYRIILQAEQKEYVISLSSLVTGIARYVAIIVLIYFGTPMWTIAFATMVFVLINNLIIYLHVKIKYKLINFKATPNFAAIKGTRDVLVQKITVALYMSLPIIAITLSAGGTMLASVYAVFNSVFLLLKGLLRAVIDAPRLGLGEFASQKSKEHVWNIFKQYQMVVFALLFILLSVASVLVMPFISIYTKNVTDINYTQPFIALAMVLTAFFELLHMPSGHLINMTGNFRVSRNIQLIGSGTLVTGLVTGAITLGLYGILGAVLLTSALLAVLQIGYVHRLFFKKKMLGFARLILPVVIIGPLVVWLEIRLLPQLNGFAHFALAGLALLLVNSVIGFAMYYLTNRATMMSLLNRFASMLPKRKRDSN
jgi:hypothetical protein